MSWEIFKYFHLDITIIFYKLIVTAKLVDKPILNCNAKVI